MAQKIIKEVLENDLHSVAKKGAVTTEQIERMLNDASDSSLSNFKPSGLKRLGLDEIALLKGKGNYCAGLIDLDKSELMAILEGRTQEKIKKVLMQWGLEVLEQIEEVSARFVEGIQKFNLRIHALYSISSRLKLIKRFET